jgi:transposase
MAAWIAGPVAERCPNAVLCIDAFHVVQGATDALDEVRRDVWNQARRSGQDQLAHRLKGARYALWKDPENLTGRQQAKLAEIQQINRRLYAPTCSRSSCARSTGCQPRRQSRCWTVGSHGHGDVAYRRS